MRKVAAAYQAGWLILDATSVVDALKPVLADQIDLAWLSDETVFEMRDDDGKPGWAVYRIDLP